MLEKRNGHIYNIFMGEMSWKQHLPSGIAGLFTISQLVLIFFYSVDGISLLRALGYIIWLVSLTFAVLPIFILKKQGEVPRGKSYIHTERLVTRGLYGIIRHPQYLAGPLLNIALMLISQHRLLIILGVPPLVLMAIDLFHADKEGLEKFGQQYQDYMKQVPRINVAVGIWRRWRK